MINKKILQKAIEKACKNGYNPCEFGNEVIETTDDFVWIGNNDHEKCGMYYQQIIFSHDFARAFWLDKQYDSDKNWQYHLQELVLYKNPLKYLEKFLQ